MKKILALALGLLFTCSASAKKVKFAVDMTGLTINVTGMHVAGDFQAAAGFAGGNWIYNTCLLTKEIADTNIYSIVVDLPAFAKYEYKFFNGDQSYDAEFVPIESRVGYNFDDNRWMYVDSLANDTTALGAVLFSSNAPAGLSLMRFLVDMQNEVVDQAGVHVAGDFQSWNPVATIEYSFVPGIYEMIVYVVNGNYVYKFYNGNTLANTESVPGSCATNGARAIGVVRDTVLATVCFSGCSACISNSVKQNNPSTAPKLFPNPSMGTCSFEFNDQLAVHDVLVSSVTGSIFFHYKNYTGSSLTIDTHLLPPGLYFVNTPGAPAIKLMVE